MAVKRPPRGASYQPKHIIQPLAYWRQRGLQMVFLGNRCVWNRDDQASGDPPTVVGGPKNNTGPYGVAQGFGPTYGTGLTDYLGGNKLSPPKAGGRSILSFFYAKTTGGGGLGRVYQDASGSGLTVGESFYISTTPGVTFAFTDAGSTLTSAWTPSFTVPTGRWCAVGIAVPFLPTVASTARAFLDGKFIASAANANGVGTGANAATNMTWGNRAAAPGNERQFDGMIGPTLIFDGVLDDRDFADLSANPWMVFPETQRRRIPATGGTPTLTIADATHGHIADNLVLTTSTALVISDATHGHTADNLTLDAATSTSLTVADAFHAHTADALTLSTDAWLTVADALHAHAADNLALTLDTWLVVADALHAHAADNLDLSGAPALLIADALHAHAADNLALTLDTWLAIQDAVHAHTADNLHLGGLYSTLDLIYKILANRQELNPTTGKFTLYDDDGVSVLYQANAWADAAGTIPYTGGTLARIDALA